jgi:hypothetical protein
LKALGIGNSPYDKCNARSYLVSVSTASLKRGNIIHFRPLSGVLREEPGADKTQDALENESVF